MHHHIRHLVSAVIVTALVWSVIACDTIRVQNSSGQPVGLLVDAQNGTTTVNDRGVTFTGSSVGITNYSSAAQSNEVVAFTNDRPPKYQATPWTPNRDTFDVPFQSLIRVPVTVWIVRGPFAAQRTHAIEACIRTSAIWQAERMGIDFGPFEVLDATANPKAPDHYAFPNGDVGDSVWKPLRDDIGFIPGRVNIYWVDTVNGGTGSGWSNFGAQIVMGKNTGDELLSHELGHALSLTHTNGDSNFDTTNIMASASNIRQYVTEGQLFRAHLNPSSVLNALYHARPGELTRSCAYGDAGPFCPLIQRRIWDDGTFPANN